MSRPTLALFTRAVREDCRGKSAYFSRAALAGMIMLFLLSTQITSGWLGAPGLMFFSEVVYINFFFITLAGLGYFSSAITEEKEEMTLGLLRMTGLNPLSILFGKSTSRLFGAFLLLLAQLPFTLLADTLGGVSVGQIAAAYCTLAAYVFLLSNMALLCSVLSKRTGGAAFMTGVLLFLFLLGPAIIRWLLTLAINASPWIRASVPLALISTLLGAVGGASPFHRLGEIFRTGFAERPVGWQVLADAGGGVAFFLLAWVCFNRFTRDESDSAPGRGMLARRNSYFRPGRAWLRAIVWKDFYFLAGGKVVLLIKIIFLSSVFVFIAWQVRHYQAEWSVVGYPTMICAYIFFMCDLAIAASRIFKQEVKWKTLSSLGALPVSVKQLAWQKASASLIAAFPAVILFCLGFALSSEEIVGKVFGESSSGSLIFGLFIGALESIFFLFLVTLFSLILKRGGLPLAIAAHYIGNMFAAMQITMTVRNTVGIMIVSSILLLVGIGMLGTLIGSRLEYLLAAD